MKYFFLITLLVCSHSVMACPDLNGSYACQDETGLVSDITVSQTQNEILLFGEQSGNLTYSLVKPTKVALGMGVSASVEITCNENSMTYIGTFWGNEVMRLSHTKNPGGFTTVDPEGRLIHCKRK